MNKSLDDFIITCESNIIYSDEIATEGIGANIANAFKNLLAAAKRILAKIVGLITGKWKKEIPKKLNDAETLKNELMEKSNGTGRLYSQLSDSEVNSFASFAFKGLGGFENEILNKGAIGFGEPLVDHLNKYIESTVEHLNFRTEKFSNGNTRQVYDNSDSEDITKRLSSLMKSLSEGVHPNDNDHDSSVFVNTDEPAVYELKVNTIIEAYESQLNKSKIIYPKLDKFLSDVKAAVAKMTSELEGLMPKLNANTSLTDAQRNEVYSTVSKTVTLANQCTNVGVVSVEKWDAGITRCANEYKAWINKHTYANKYWPQLDKNKDKK